jgi:AcrR family transcriptional regulator
MTRADERRVALKEALVDAAERMIDARGLGSLKARDLAQDVGCAVGAIYNVLPDLDTLILTVNLRTLAMFERAIAALPPEAAGCGHGQIEGAVADLVRLALAYLDFASEHPRRWRALFQHRMAGDRPPPPWYRSEQVRLFRYIEEPLRVLCPHRDAAERTLLARTLFSATHGMVSLGLDEKLATIPPPLLRRHVETVVRATGEGLAARP